MVDIEKEREAFEDWYCKNHTGLKQSVLAKFRTLSGYSFSDSLRIDISWEAWQAAKAQAEIDDLKAQINALEESRMTWREYAMKIESGEYELVKKADVEKCVWRESEDGIWNTACGELESAVLGYFCQNCGKKIEEVIFEEIK